MFVTLTVLSLALLMMVVERLKPGRIFPTVSDWWIRSILLNLVQIGMVSWPGTPGMAGWCVNGRGRRIF